MFALYICLSGLVWFGVSKAWALFALLLDLAAAGSCACVCELQELCRSTLVAPARDLGAWLFC